MNRNTSTCNTHSCILCGLPKYESEGKRSFFNFPKNEMLKKQWIKRCNIPEEINVSSARLCSKHFKEEDYSNRGSTVKRARLKRDAVPSIFFNSPLLEDKKSSKDVCSSSTRKTSAYSQYCTVCKERTTRSTMRFPKDKSEAERWLQFFNIQPDFGDRNIKFRNMRICDKHFEKMYPDGSIHLKGSNIRLIRDHENDFEINGNVEEPTTDPLGEFTQPLNNEIVQTVGEQHAGDVMVPVQITITPIIDPECNRSKTGSTSRLIFPRYPNDIRPEHLNSPRSARRCLQITKDVIARKNSEIASIRQQLRRANKKIENLEQIITHLCEKFAMNEDMTDSLMFAEQEEDNVNHEDFYIDMPPTRKKKIRILNRTSF